VIQTQSPCTFFALGTVHFPHTACSTTDVSENRRFQSPLCARVLPCLRAPCPYLRVPILRPGPTLACLCLAYATCVLFARVCHVIISGDPHTNPLRVSYSAHCTWMNKHTMKHKGHPQNETPTYMHVTSTQQTHCACISCQLFSVVVITVCAETLSLYPMPLLSLSSAQPPLSDPSPGPHTRGGALPSVYVICVSACMCVCACVSRECLCADVFVCARLFGRICVRVYVCKSACVCVCVFARACVRLRVCQCTCTCTYAGVCVRACVRLSVCVFPSYLQYVSRNLTSATAALSQCLGFAHVCLGLVHLGYLPCCSRPPNT